MIACERPYTLRRGPMSRVFINYRRGSTSAYAGRIYDALAARFGESRVFIDVDTIRPGSDFVEMIDQTIASSGLMLAVIGPGWATVGDAEGEPRIADPSDFVRMEISAALEKGIGVLPVLVQGAQMPPSRLLPDDLQPLTRRHAFEIGDSRWGQDINELIGSVEAALAEQGGGAAPPAWQRLERPSEPGPAGPPAPSPASPRSGPSSTTVAIVAVLAALVVAGGAIAAFALTSGGDDAGGGEPAASSGGGGGGGGGDGGANGSADPEADTATAGLPDFETYASAGGGWQASVPASGGWSDGVETQVNSGLHRTTFTGPDGAVLIVDSTPAEPPIYDGDAARSPAEHPVYDGVEKLAFRGNTSVTPCETATCVDFLIPAGAGGYAVLAGGPGDFAELEGIAETTMKSIGPLGG